MREGGSLSFNKALIVVEAVGPQEETQEVQRVVGAEGKQSR